MLKNFALLVMVLLASILSLSCSSEDDNQPKLPANDSAFGPANGPVPSDARLVGAQDFAQLWESGGLILDGPKANAEAARLKAESAAADDRTIQEYIARNPGLASVVPRKPVPSARLTEQYDGNYLLNILTSDGSQRKVMTMSYEWMKSTLASAIVANPGIDTPKAHESYERLYGILLEGVRVYAPEWYNQNGAGLPSVQTVHDADLRTKRLYNSFILNRWYEISDYIKPDLVGGQPASCDLERNSGTGGDRYGNAATCGFKATGIYSNYDFPNKPFTTCVKNQAVRGSCPAFSTVSAIETWVARNHNQWINLSEQAYYNRAKYDWWSQHLWDGFGPVSGMEKMIGTGFRIPYENKWNYNPSPFRLQDKRTGAYEKSCDGYTETCSDSAHQSERVCAKDREFLFCGYLSANKNPENKGFAVSEVTQIWDHADKDLSLVKVILAALFRQPIVWSFAVPPSWYDAGDDGYLHYIDDKEETDGGHAVHIVGVITNEQLDGILPNAPLGSGGGYFIVKNSWSTCWGDGGYAYVPFDFVRAYTTQMVVVHGVTGQF